MRPSGPKVQAFGDRPGEPCGDRGLGMPMMIVSIAIAHLYVWWRYF
jgi:hypothetical protein